MAAVDRVLSSGAVLLGPEIAAFEHEFATFTGYDYCVGMSSGATALQLALVASGIGPGDEVLVPAHTAVPTASAVLATGAVPVLVDVERQSGAIDLDAARLAVTERTKAVIPVHLYGRPARLPTSCCQTSHPRGGTSKTTGTDRPWVVFRRRPRIGRARCSQSNNCPFISPADPSWTGRASPCAE